jgi:peroxin-5
MALGQLRGAAAPNMAVMEQSRMLAHTLSQDTNPKFQVSSSHAFYSK